MKMLTKHSRIPTSNLSFGILSKRLRLRRSTYIWGCSASISTIKMRDMLLTILLSRRAVLLSSTLDSFEAILMMLLEAVKANRSQHAFDNQYRSKAISKVQEYGRKSLWLLDESQRQIITQADENLYFDNQNSCLSGERLLITILERLTHGVFSRGTIDVISIYTACLENLVSNPVSHL